MQVVSHKLGWDTGGTSFSAPSGQPLEANYIQQYMYLNPYPWL